jgi:mRNA interferase RelE/StbE
VYRIEFTRQAEKQLEKVHHADRDLYERFMESFEEIRKYPESGKPLKHELKGLRSYRIGSYRIIYQVLRSRLLVIVVDLGHRREIYER